MKYDSWLRGGLDHAVEDSHLSEQLNFDGAWTGESNSDAFLPLALAAEHTDRIEIGTAVALAFARNPMLVAYKAVDLQHFSRGRLVLGLGSQTRAHIVRRYSMTWSNPAARMRDFVRALHAIWLSWETETQLDYQGEFYRHSLMTPTFVPDSNPYGRPKVFIAAVGTTMIRVAAEVADGLFVHPFCSERYLREVIIPTVVRHRPPTLAPLEIALSPYVVSTDREIDLARQEIAFYGSTPAYRPILELHGWGALQDDLKEMSIRGEWYAMGQFIDDEILQTFCCIGDDQSVATELIERYSGAADRLRITHPGRDSNPARSQGVLDALRRIDRSTHQARGQGDILLQQSGQPIGTPEVERNE